MAGMSLQRRITRTELARAVASLAASGAVHVALAAALVGWLGGKLLLPETAGQQHVVSLEAVFSQPQALLVADDSPELDAPVVITPDEARIAERHFVRESTQIEGTPQAVPEPSETPPVPPAELARAAKAEEAEPTTSAQARKLPRQQSSSSPAPASTASAPQVAGTNATLPPEMLANMPPSYPNEAVRNGWRGTVVLRVLVTIEGTAGEVTLVTSSGYPVLDAAAVRAVRGWKFRPAMRDGVPVEMTVRAPITFAL